MGQQARRARSKTVRVLYTPEDLARSIRRRSVVGHTSAGARARSQELEPHVCKQRPHGGHERAAAALPDCCRQRPAPARHRAQGALARAGGVQRRYLRAPRSPGKRRCAAAADHSVVGGFQGGGGAGERGHPHRRRIQARLRLQVPFSASNCSWASATQPRASASPTHPALPPKCTHECCLTAQI